MKLFRFLFVSRHDHFLLILSLVLLSRESDGADGQLSGSDYGQHQNPSIQHLEPCGAVIHNTSNGVIESPDYPDSYPSSVNCEWTVQAEEGQLIQVTFFDIRTQSPSVPFGEAHDYLDVSLTGRVKDTQRYSGDLNAITPFTLLTEGNKLYLRFHSEHNHDPAYTGFRLAYHVRNVTESSAFSAPTGAIAATCKLDPKDVPAPTTENPDVVKSAAQREHEDQLDLEFAELDKLNRSNPHPYLVALVLEDKQFCSGTLVRNDFVLTSAYCTQNVEKIEMIFGTSDTTLNDAGVQKRHVTAKDIIPHPYFDPVTGVNDISLIKLSEPVKVSQFVKAVRLPSWSLLGNVFSGYGVKIAGWGQHSDGRISSQSRSKDLLIAPNSACRSSLFKGVTGMMMCSKKENTQRCQADLGSPITTRCNPSSYRLRKKPSKPVLSPPSQSSIPGIPPPNGGDSEQPQLFPGQPTPPSQPNLPGAAQGPSFITNGVPSSCYRMANSLFTRKQQEMQTPAINIYRPRKSNNRPQKPSGKPNKRPQRPGGKPNKRPQRPGKPNKRPQRPGGKPNKRPQRPGGKPNKRPQRPGGKPNKRPQRPGGKPNKRPQRPGGKPNKRPQRPGGKPNKRPQRPGGKPNKRPQRPGGKPNKRPQRPGGKPNKRPQRPSGKPNKRPQPPGCQNYSRSPNVLLGIVSFGDCNKGFVFTRITAYLDFLSDNMGSWYDN